MKTTPQYILGLEAFYSEHTDKTNDWEVYIKKFFNTDILHGRWSLLRIEDPDCGDFETWRSQQWNNIFNSIEHYDYTGNQYSLRWIYIEL